jgi:DNA-binding beta-propeller fold protein YncE
LAEAFDVAVSPDGLSVYVTSVVGDQIAIFDREPGTGELAQKTGPAGCIGERGGSCDTGHGLDDATRIVVSPDGISVLVASFASDSLTVFDRRPLPYDLDDNGEVEPLTDNLLLLRYLFGLRGSILTNGAVDLEGCMRCTAPEIEAFIEAILE